MFPKHMQVVVWNCNQAVIRGKDISNIRGMNKAYADY